jgi:hypothetical protein
MISEVIIAREQATSPPVPETMASGREGGGG